MVDLLGASPAIGVPRLQMGAYLVPSLVGSPVPQLWSGSKRGVLLQLLTMTPLSCNVACATITTLGLC